MKRKSNPKLCLQRVGGWCEPVPVRVNPPWSCEKEQMILSKSRRNSPLQLIEISGFT